jgi:hypothetical protein
MHKCPKCGGSGNIQKYKHVESGVCFECSGSGTVTDEELLRIEKDIAKEIKKQQNKIENDKKKLIESLKKIWFNNSDKIYVINESNTFSIKNQLKDAGAIFNGNHKVWFFTELNNSYPVFEITWAEVLNDNNIGYSVNLKEIIKNKSNGNLRGF